MFDNIDNEQEIIGENDGFDILKELEQNTPDAIRRQRAHFRITIKTKIILQPGNVSQLLDFKVQGITGDISQGGMQALFPIPTNVGDIYRLTFDQEKLDLPITFARCVRCRFVREEAFECGFKFFAPISLPEHMAVTSDA